MKSEEKRILILKPATTATGGISNYFEVIKQEFSLPVDFFVRGARTWPYKPSFFKEIIRFIHDNYRFIKTIYSEDYKIVQTSTSLGPLSVIRDGLFLWMAQLKGIKTIVFYRGWDENYEAKLEQKYLGLFKKVFFSTDCSIVLSGVFKEKLISWGYENPIYIETTIVDSNLFDDINFDIPQKRENDYKNYGVRNFLFLARIEKEKGIYETLEAFKIAKEIHQDITLTIAGDGRELESVKSHVKEQNIEDVTFPGFVVGNEKKRAFLDADVYLFPSYSEGMPNSVLEAMAFGLPVIGTPVGGLNDILEDYKTGFRIPVRNTESLVEKINEMIENPDVAAKISANNYELAHSKFTLESVIERMEKIYQHTLYNNG